MADDHTKDLIKECAENLLKAVQHLQNAGTAQSTNIVQTPNATPSTQSPSASTIQGEYRSMFSFRPPSNCGSARAPKRRIMTFNTGKGKRFSFY